MSKIIAKYIHFSMSKIKVNYIQICFLIFAFSIFCIIILHPSRYLSSVSQGIMLWATIILPGLVPFVFISNIMSKMQSTFSVCSPLAFVTNKCFKSPKCTGYIYFMSILSGYPLGAKLVEEFYDQGLLSYNDAKTAISYCSTSGPIFMIGSVGVSLFVSQTSGLIIFLSHIFASFFNGFLFKNKQKPLQNNVKKVEGINQNILSDSMYQTVLSCIFVGGFIAFAYLLIDIFYNFGIINFIGDFIDNVLLFGKGNFGQYIASGILEVTRGCLELSQSSISITAKTIIASGLTAFGGLSVHLQSMGFLSQIGIKYSYFFKTKIAHTVITVVLSYVFCLIIF